MCELGLGETKPVSSEKRLARRCLSSTSAARIGGRGDGVGEAALGVVADDDDEEEDEEDGAGVDDEEEAVGVGSKAVADAVGVGVVGVGEVMVTTGGGGVAIVEAVTTKRDGT